MLEFRDVHSGYGRSDVLHGVSLRAPEGAVSVLLGANGAGKSTTVRTAIGAVETTAGRVLFEESDVTDDDIAANVRRGMALVPEGGRVFSPFSVRRNLTLGAYTVTDDEERRRRQREVLELFPILGDRLEQRAGTLSGGERQMLAIGRALMSAPRLLMLDEPFLGLAPRVVDAVVDAIERIKDRGITLFVVEQSARILAVADRAFAMRLGEIVIEEEEPDRLASGDGARALEQAFLG